jgi:hypothetical protein
VQAKIAFQKTGDGFIMVKFQEKPQIVNTETFSFSEKGFT